MPTRSKDSGVSRTPSPKDLDTSIEVKQQTITSSPTYKKSKSRGEEAKQIGPENPSSGRGNRPDSIQPINEYIPIAEYGPFNHEMDATPIRTCIWCYGITIWHPSHSLVLF